MAAEAALAEFQKLVTVAVQKGLMDMSDARVSRHAVEAQLAHSSYVDQSDFAYVFRLLVGSASHFPIHHLPRFLRTGVSRCIA